MVLHTVRVAALVGFMVSSAAMAQNAPVAVSPQASGGNSDVTPLARSGESKSSVALAMLIGPTDPAEILQTHPEADANHDGRLSGDERRTFMESRQAELNQELLTAHPELDNNRDNILSPEELHASRGVVEQFVSEKILTTHPEADRNADGKLDRDELKAWREKQASSRSSGTPIDWVIQNFQSIDQDGNGQITLEELQSFKQQQMGQHGHKAAKPEKAEKIDKQRKHEAKAEGKSKKEKKNKQAAPQQ